MKFTDLHAFENHLRTAPRPHLALLITPDPYDGEVALGHLKGALELETLCPLDGEQLSGQQLSDALDGGSLFGDRSSVLIRNVEKVKPALLEKIERYASAPASDLDVILMASSLPAAAPLVKGVAKTGLLLLLPQEKPWTLERTLPDWVRQEGRRMGKEVSIETARLLVGRLGTSKFALRGELEKLSCYVGDRPHIGLQDVEKMTAQVAEHQVWELGRAIVGGQSALAIRLVGRLMGQGVPLVLLMAHLRGQFQTGLQICTLHSRGEPLGPHLPHLSGKRLEMVAKEALRCGSARYRCGLFAVQEAERLSRLVGVEDRIVMERFVAEVAA